MQTEIIATATSIVAGIVTFAEKEKVNLIVLEQKENLLSKSYYLGV